MADEVSFAELIRRVRAGDEQAAADLVRRYEPEIRCEVRLRLRHSRVRRFVDSMDICQSVLASFFARAALGQYDLDEPGQLVRLLVTMARNKLVNQVHRHQARRRDCRRDEAGGIGPREPADRSPSPSELVAGDDLLHAFRNRLSAEERQLADLRGQGRTWEEIARELGGTANGRRVQLVRAANRVSQQLGLDEEEP